MFPPYSRGSAIVIPCVLLSLALHQLHDGVIFPGHFSDSSPFSCFIPTAFAQTSFRFCYSPANGPAMSVDKIVNESTLVAVLQISDQARDQAHTLLRLTDQARDGRPSAELQAEIAKQQKHLFTSISQLRGLHRTACISARETKTSTSEARQEVDRLHLQLQNLYYEQRHLQGEISACESYEYVLLNIYPGS